MEREKSFQDLGITLYKGKNLSCVGKQLDSQYHYEAWEQSKVDEAFDAKSGASTTIFDLDKLGMSGNTAYELVAFHRPKNESE